MCILQLPSISSKAAKTHCSHVRKPNWVSSLHEWLSAIAFVVFKLILFPGKRCTTSLVYIFVIYHKCHTVSNLFFPFIGNVLFVKKESHKLGGKNNNEQEQRVMGYFSLFFYSWSLWHPRADCERPGYWGKLWLQRHSGLPMQPRVQAYWLLCSHLSAGSQLVWTSPSLYM